MPSPSPDHSDRILASPSRPHSIFISTAIAPPAAHTLHIPLEVLYNIISLLSKAELVNCSRASRAVHTIAAPHLYARVEINLPDEHPYPHPSIPRFDIGVERFAFTTHLTINSHASDLCQHIAGPTLPNLVTLRIVGAMPHFCCSSTDTPEESMDHALCPIIAHLRPRRLVLDRHGEVSRTPHGLTMPSGRFPPSCVEDLVVVFPHGPSFVKALHGGLSYHSIRDGPALHRLTYVIPPAAPGGGGSVVSDRLASLMQTGHSFRTAWDSLWEVLCRCLARLYLGHLGICRMMGLEALGAPEGLPGLALKEKEEAIRKAVYELSVRGGRDASKAKAKADSIRFEPYGDYEGTEMETE